MIIDKEVIKQSLVQFLVNLGDTLKNRVKERSSPGRISIGAWIDEPNTIRGVISFRPHSVPGEEIIELGMAIGFASVATLLIDIYWSDGEIISAITEEDVEFVSEQDLRERLLQKWRDFSPRLLHEMTELIIQDREPRYRPH